MATPKVNGAKLKRAIEKFGSLKRAVEDLQNEKLDLEKENGQLRKEKAKLKLNRDKLLAEVKEVDDKLNHKTTQFQELSSIQEQSSRQYALFEGFLAMITSSPSVGDSVESLISVLRTLLESGWQISKKADDARSLFVRTIMGDYLRCYGCANCGAAFLVNKKPHYEYFYNYYVCPACHNHSGVEADASFLKAMVSEKQQENIRLIEGLQKEYDALTPFKLFFDIPCEMCKAPVTEWTKQTLEKGIKGLGWGHGRCWTTSAGQLVQLTRLLDNRWPR